MVREVKMGTILGRLHFSFRIRIPCVAWQVVRLYCFGMGGILWYAVYEVLLCTKL